MTLDGRWERLRHAMLLVTSDLSLHAVLQHITSSACDLVDARYAALGVIGSDGLLSEFVYTGVFATGLEPQVVAGRLPAAQFELGSRLEKAVEDLDDTIREIRTTIFSLHDYAVTESQAGVTAAELEARLRDVAREASRPLRYSASVVCNLSYDGTVSAELAGHVLSATREALANVARHALATECDVELHVSDEIVPIIENNGVGFPADSTRQGYGLRNMANRAQTTGGWSRLEPRNGGGTRLEWRGPVAPAA